MCYGGLDFEGGGKGWDGIEGGGPQPARFDSSYPTPQSPHPSPSLSLFLFSFFREVWLTLTLLVSGLDVRTEIFLWREEGGGVGGHAQRFYPRACFAARR